MTKLKTPSEIIPPLKSFQKDDVGRYLLSSWRKKQQHQRQGKKFNFFPESAVTQLTAMKHFFTSLFSPNFVPETQTKGQLISKGLFGVIVWTKTSTKFILRISALASKKRSNQKNEIK